MDDDLAVGGAGFAGGVVRRGGNEALVRAQAFGEALSVLRYRSGVDELVAARQADLAPTELRRILAGDCVPGWPVAHMLTTVFGGQPQETRFLWEVSQGMKQTARLSPADAGRNLRYALRGLHLAAGCPSSQEISDATGVSADVVVGVLSGCGLPNWSTAAALAAGFSAGPEAIRGLWEDLDYARMISQSPRAADEACLPDTGKEKR
ncbi:hypothetical protein ACR820_34390 [Streptomyces netropsis]